MIIIFEYGLFGGTFWGIYFIVRPIGKANVDLYASKTFFDCCKIYRLIGDKALNETVTLEFGTRYGCNDIEPSTWMINPPEEINGFLHRSLIFSRTAED